MSQISEGFKKEGKQPIQLTPADPDLQADDLLEMVNAGLVPMTVAEDNLAKVFAKVLPNLVIHSDLVVAEGPACWAIQKDTPQLKAAVNEFIKGHRIGTAYGNTLRRKYLRDEKWVKDATARKDLERFEEMVRLFRQYGEKYDFPYLLLAAQGLSGIGAQSKPEEQGRRGGRDANQAEYRRRESDQNSRRDQDGPQRGSRGQVFAIHGRSILCGTNR